MGKWSPCFITIASLLLCGVTRADWFGCDSVKADLNGCKVGLDKSAKALQQCEAKHQEYTLHNAAFAFEKGNAILGSFHGATALEDCEARVRSLGGKGFYCLKN